MSKEIILASSSRYRRALLERLGVPFTAVASDMSETPLPGEPARSLAERLAVCKAGALSEDYGDHLIIGSDQVAVIDKQILGKPGDFDNAKAQLEVCSGQTVTFYTSVALLDSGTGQYLCTSDVTKVHFRPLSEREITSYLHRETPYDCAGSFKAEGLGIALFRGIENLDPTGIQGLPLIIVARMLRKFGVELF